MVDAIADYDLVWASPPCAPYSGARLIRGYDTHQPDLVAATCRMLDKHQYSIIENVPPAARAGQMRADVTLAWQMFDLEAPMPRRRIFQTSFPAPIPPPDPGFAKRGRRVLISATGTGGLPSTRRQRREAGLSPYTSIQELRDAMQAPWVGAERTATATRIALNAMIPACYARWLGARARDAMEGIPYPRQLI